MIGGEDTTAILDEMFGTILLVWREGLMAGLVIAVSAVVGWRIGQAQGNWLARVVRWWLNHVVHPLFASRTWLRRAIIIAVNNSLICAVVVLLGSLGHVAWIGITGVGLGLGIALRLMNEEIEPGLADREPSPRHHRTLVTIGMALNLLEVPAVMLSAGLSLGQALSSSLALADALTAFAWFVLPLLLVGAAGEALWMHFSSELSQCQPPA